MYRNYIVILILMCAMLSPLQGKAGINAFFTSKDSVNSSLNEKVCLFTDRTMYVIGEKVLFSATILNSPSLGAYDWSKVLYLELIGANGKPEVQTKHLITDFKSNGYLRLPENIPTGYYFIKAYTRWMQNFPSSSFSWVRIKVINPFQKSVANVFKENENSEDDGIVPVRKLVSDMNISCHTERLVYGRRDKVTLNLSVPHGADHPQGQYCITVIRPDAMNTGNYGIYGPQLIPGSKNFPVKFIPDLRGLSLTGKVIDNSTGQGVSQAHVRLSVLDKKADYSSYFTQDNGGFVFALQHFTGTTDMFIMVDPNENRSMRILVDTEYANGNPDFLPVPFHLSEKEEEAATEMMINFQIEKSYHVEGDDTSADDNQRIWEFFYGNPVNTIHIDNYIELPNMEEVIFELVPEVAIIRRNDVYYLRSNGYFSDLEIYKPLIMIDNIPVTDIGAMLKMSPERIDRIDVIDRIYAKGDLLFGGILNLISRKGDMAGIDLPENSYFFSFDGFVQSEPVSLIKNTNQYDPARIPDMRNCLYWNPSVDIRPGETVELEFRTGDRTGSYMIVVRGITAEGKIIEGNAVFEVAGSMDRIEY